MGLLTLLLRRHLCGLLLLQSHVALVLVLVRLQGYIVSRLMEQLVLICLSVGKRLVRILAGVDLRHGQLRCLLHLRNGNLCLVVHHAPLTFQHEFLNQILQLLHLLALLLARAGLPVLVHGQVSEPAPGASGRGRVTSAAIFEALGAERAVACHWGTFQLTTEPYDEPPQRLAAALAKAGIAAERFVAPPPGGAARAHDSPAGRPAVKSRVMPGGGGGGMGGGGGE